MQHLKSLVFNNNSLKQTNFQKSLVSVEIVMCISMSRSWSSFPSYLFTCVAARLDSRRGVRRVFGVTVLIALVYSVVQFILELMRPDKRFHVPNTRYDLYGHGGMLFLFTSSTLLAAVYAGICLLPFTGCRRFPLPSKFCDYFLSFAF